MAESVVGLKALSAVLELDPDEVTVFGGRSATELKGESRSVIGCRIMSIEAMLKSKIILTDTSQLRVLLDHLKHVEQGDERVVGGLDEEELKRVTVECNTLERVQDRVEDCATSH